MTEGSIDDTPTLGSGSIHSYQFVLTIEEIVERSVDRHTFYVRIDSAISFY